MRPWFVVVLTLVVQACTGPESTFERMADWAETYREDARPLLRPVASMASLEYGSKPALKDCEELGREVARARDALKGAPDLDATDAILEALRFFDEAASLCRSNDPKVLVQMHWNLAQGRIAIGQLERILQSKYQQPGIPGLGL